MGLTWQVQHPSVGQRICPQGSGRHSPVSLAQFGQVFVTHRSGLQVVVAQSQYCPEDGHVMVSHPLVWQAPATHFCPAGHPVPHESDTQVPAEQYSLVPQVTLAQGSLTH